MLLRTLRLLPRRGYTDLNLFRKRFAIRIWEIAVHVSTFNCGAKAAGVGKEDDTPSALLRTPRHTCIKYEYRAEAVKSRAKNVALLPTPDGR